MLITASVSLGPEPICEMVFIRNNLNLKDKTHLLLFFVLPTRPALTEAEFTLNPRQSFYSIQLVR